MMLTSFFDRSMTALPRIGLARIATAAFFVVLTACGGSANPPPPPEGGAGTAPTITQQPADLTVTSGQSAGFSVVASGTGPLSYQWQRDGVDIAGATSTSYALSTTTMADNGAVFRAVVSNAAGSATSSNATLTVSATAPVLTITPQPASISATAGAQASFTVGGTCSSGSLAVQWQRQATGGASFADIAGATSATYSFMSVLGDDGAMFRAVLNCSGQSSTPSNVATLTVTAPGTVTLTLLPTTGLRDQAQIASLSAIDQETAGSYAFITGNRIKRLSADLSTIDLVAGSNGSSSADGPAASAGFNQPQGVTHDAAGNLYIADTNNHTIRRIAADGAVSTIAGLAGASGSTDGVGNAARFDRPWGIALGPDGDLYVSELGNHLVRRVTMAGGVTTYAGSTAGYLDGAALTAMFSSPTGIAVAANGDVLVADRANNRMRRILRSGNAAGVVETLAGSGSASTTAPDGVGIAAGIPFPGSAYVRGNTLVVRDLAGLVRQIDLTTKAVTTLTGSRTLGSGFADGTAVTARLRDLGYGITGAPSGAFIAADDLGLRFISAAGDVTTLADSAANGQSPTGVGTLPQQPFGLAVNRFNSLTVDPSGRVVVADDSTRQVRRVDATGAVTLVAGLTGGIHGVVDGVGSAAQFSDLGPSIASSSTGVLYVWDSYGVRRIGTDNAVTMLAGSTAIFGAVDGDSTTARFNRVFGLAVGPTGDVFAADAGNSAVRRIDAAGNTTTFAGVMGQASVVDGPIATARFVAPRKVAFAPDGTLYVLDNGTLRSVTPDGSTVSTVGSLGASAMAVDMAGAVYFTTNSGGLYVLASGASNPTLLIPATAGANVLGSNPQLAAAQSLAVLGPKQIVIISYGQLLVANLP